ncbi:MAG: hypothetical protein NUW37_04420 [Planctomycetes bacterium]|nr:hypothetical protein [Planctomycetota bacterium]
MEDRIQDEESAQPRRARKPRIVEPDEDFDDELEDEDDVEEFEDDDHDGGFREVKIKKAIVEKESKYAGLKSKDAQMREKRRESLGAFRCPYCSGWVGKNRDDTTEMMLWFLAGLPSLLFYAAFQAYECYECGEIPSRDFPPEIRRKMLLSRIFLSVLAILLLAMVAFSFGGFWR